YGLSRGVHALQVMTRAPYLAEAVARCRADKHCLAAIDEIYREVDALFTRTGCDCRACGRCCRFDLMDHRLYASAGEIACLLERTTPPGSSPGVLRCPYHVEPHCRARAGRTLGCRTYFCYPPAAIQAGQEAYERFHRRLRALHEKHGLPYLYVELTAALTDLLGL
ncbi:MAG: hypothetical protein NT031_16360, partial [Planctomycetota bacterium]|nr:hypothetical protein [Planctomycetota bacterium]